MSLTQLDERAWMEIRKRIDGHHRLSIFTDFDGTLSPLVRTPNEARIDADAARILTRLADSPGVKLAVISGRSLLDLAARVVIDGLYLAGSHGIEIAGPTISFIHPLAARGVQIKSEMTRSLRSAFLAFPGVLIEEKPYSIACHYRGATRAGASLIFRTIRRTLPDHLRGWRILRGRDVIEILPLKWNKGSCVHLLLEHYIAADPRWAGSLSLAIGDDATDQDLFRAILPMGLSFAVGTSARLRADFRLSGTEEVCRLLAICDRRGGFGRESPHSFHPL